MTPAGEFEIFLMAPPGLEKELCEEARERGFRDPKQMVGGVTVTGGWTEAWRANLELRGCGRVLARIGAGQRGAADHHVAGVMACIDPQAAPEQFQHAFAAMFRRNA